MDQWLSAHCKLQHTRPSNCAQLMPHTPSTLLYLGSDVDVQMIHQLAPWETRILMVDSMVDGGIIPDAGWAHYDALHVHDPRAAFRNTTRRLRASCGIPTAEHRIAGKTGCSAALKQEIGNLLEGRLRALESVSRVRRLGPLTMQLALRQSQFMQPGGGEEASSSSHERQVALEFLPLDADTDVVRLAAALNGSGGVSTVATVGYTGAVDSCRLLPPRRCVPAVRLLGMASEQRTYLANNPWLAELRAGAHIASYPQRDTLSGDRGDVTSFCAVRRHVGCRRAGRRGRGPA